MFDRSLKRVVGFLKEFYPNTIVVVAGDHGGREAPQFYDN